MKKLVLVALGLASFGFASAAQAAVTLNANGTVTANNLAGSNVAVINFNGFGDNGVIGTLGATLTLTLANITGNTFNFTYSLQNTSTAAGARISSLGFDVAPNISIPLSSVSGAFDTLEGGANYPVGFGTVEACVYDGPGGTCTGNGSGIAFGATGAGTLALTFDSPQTSITLSRLVDRYQGFNVGGVSSAIGVPQNCADCTPTQTGLVPEPATWAMFIFGFAAVGYSLRRRKPYRLAQAV